MEHYPLLKFLHRFFMAVVIVFGCSSCDYEAESVYVDDTTEEYELYDYYVDQYGNEGVVVYMLNTGSKMQIVISADETCLPWGPTGEQIFELDSVSRTMLTSPAYGIAMLQTMKARGIDRFPAQAWCNQKNHDERYPQGGSWHLPTYWELVLIFGNKGARVSNINKALQSIGGTVLSLDNMYWSCTEDYEGYAKISDITSDYDSENRSVITSPARTTYSTKERWMKKNSHYVRAIKYVYYEG
ncbi:MAG: hypothetical protein J6Y15_07190 [Bacteroidaceae bacterium]|nr:hypothetical protein [Bacteroidaceae bacterium]